MHKELAKHAFYYKGAIICNCNIFSILSIIFFTFPFLFILIIITVRFVLFSRAHIEQFFCGVATLYKCL